jgi:excisionase family DNA binding protein
MHGTEATSTPANGGMLARRVHSVPEVASLLGITERFVWTLIKDGDLESIKIGARRVVPIESIDAFIERRREEERQVRAAPASTPSAAA